LSLDALKEAIESIEKEKGTAKSPPPTLKSRDSSSEDENKENKVFLFDKE
jgi:hypothetical protein